jgi:hypothetical protein
MTVVRPYGAIVAASARPKSVADAPAVGRSASVAARVPGASGSGMPAEARSSRTASSAMILKLAAGRRSVNQRTVSGVIRSSSVSRTATTVAARGRPVKSVVVPIGWPRPRSATDSLLVPTAPPNTRSRPARTM